MRIRCPHCHNAVEVVNDLPSADVICPSCGSGFNLLPETVSCSANQSAIGHFELLDELGTGGFGTVWKAHDTQLDRLVAIKVPRLDRLDSNQGASFLREARAAAQLRHPHIVAVHEVGNQDGTLYIVSEFVHGVTLADRLTAGSFSPRDAAKLMATVADAVHHAHEAGVIHRDLKPQNIMLDGEQRPLVMDFGLAKREAGEITMTIDGKVLGTPAYMSPEQARGEGHHVDRRTDVYSLGVILFELLAGERPFRGNQRMLLHQVIHDEAPSPRKFNSHIARDLETICLKAIAKEPARRYPSAAELAQDLRRFLAGEPISARSVGRIERTWRWCRRSPTQAALVLMLCVLAIGGPIVGWQQADLRRGEKDQREQAQRSGFNAQLGRVAGLIESNTSAARQLLTNQALLPPRFRDFTWRALELRLDRKARVLSGHGDLIHSLAFSPDSTRLASIDHTGTTLLWDIESDKPRVEVFRSKAASTWMETVEGEWRGRLVGGFEPHSSLRFSACGRYLIVHWAPFGTEVTDIRPPELRVFDTERGQFRDYPKAERFAVSSVGPLLAFTLGEQVIVSWLDRQQTVNASLPAGFGALGDLGFDATGERLLAVSKEGGLAMAQVSQELSVWYDIGTLKVAEQSGICLSPNGERIAVCTLRKNSEADRDDESPGNWWLEVYDTSLNGLAEFRIENVSESEARRGLKPVMKWLADNQNIMTSIGSVGRLFRFHDSTIELVKQKAIAGIFWWKPVAVGPSGNLAVSELVRPEFDRREIQIRVIDSAGRTSMTDRYRSESDEDNLARQLTFAKMKDGVLLLEAPTENRKSLTASSDGRYLATGDGSREIRLWQVQCPDVSWQTQQHSNRVFDLRFSSDGTRLMSADDDKVVLQWDTLTGEVLRQSSLNGIVPTKTFLVDLGAGGDRILVAPTERLKSLAGLMTRDLFVFDVKENRIVSKANTSGARLEDGQLPRISQDGKFVIARLRSGGVVVWDANSGKEFWKLELLGEGRGFTLHSDGTLVTCSLHAGSPYLQFWDIATKQQTHVRRLTPVNEVSDFTVLGHAGRHVILALDGQRTWYDLERDRMIVANYVSPNATFSAAWNRSESAMQITDLKTNLATSVPISAVRFDWSGDGKTMFTANLDSTVTCWDALTGQERVTFSTGLGSITAMALSPRGSAVAAADENGRVAVIRASEVADQ